MKAVPALSKTKNLRDVLEEVLKDAEQVQSVVMTRDKNGRMSFLTFNCPSNVETGGLLHYGTEFNRFQIHQELKQTLKG